MGNLDKAVSDLTLPELQRLIRQEISRQVPPIPARILELADSDNPLLTPLSANNANALVYNAASGRWDSGQIVAESLEAVLVLANTLVAGDPDGGRVEFGLGTGDMEGMIGVHAMRSDGVITFMVHSQTGEVFIKGRIDFGSGSRLTVDDIIELKEQTETWQTPAVVQSPSNSTVSGGASSVSTMWTSPTTLGNCLLMIVSGWDPDGTVPTPTTPSGWTLLKSATGQQQFLRIYRATTGAVRSGSESITLGDSVYAVMHLLELSGVQVAAQDADANNSGTASSVDSGTSGTTTQADEIFLGILCNRDEALGGLTNAAAQSNPTNGFSLLSHDHADQAVSHGGGLFKLQARHRQYVYKKNVTSTGTANVSASLSGDSPWLGAVLALKAKAAGVETPDTNLVRLYARAVSGAGTLHAKNDTGTDGAVVLGKAGEVWRCEYVSATHNIGSLAAQGGSSIAVVLPTGSAAVGDLVMCLGAPDVTDLRTILFNWEAVVTTADRAKATVFNTDNASRDPDNATFHFLIIHRS